MSRTSQDEHPLDSDARAGPAPTEPAPTGAADGTPSAQDTPEVEAANPHEAQLLAEVAAAEERKLRARAERNKGMWFGLGMFGLVGWSVAIPTLAAIALGVWLDRRFPSQYSWTLMLLVVGIALGCFNAWYWLSKERELI